MIKSDGTSIVLPIAFPVVPPLSPFPPVASIVGFAPAGMIIEPLIPAPPFPVPVALPPKALTVPPETVRLPSIPLPPLFSSPEFSPPAAVTVPPLISILPEAERIPEGPHSPKPRLP